MLVGVDEENVLEVCLAIQLDGLVQLLLLSSNFYHGTLLLSQRGSQVLFWGTKVLVTAAGIIGKSALI